MESKAKEEWKRRCDD